ncbi:MAG: methionyl-tRNA formyltransferase [Helicobacter sp.]|uniref:methionyl-tRNA formyltransferase n=1 Tax=Helicobacter sp. TaxID=218 RepID=UPI0037534FB9|nr:methionyl-tRNA formyltransferase [Helicobacter sp.]
MRILLAGTPAFAKIAFENLLHCAHTDTESLTLEIIGLLTQPDRIFGRKKELKAPETKEFMCSLFPNIPIFQPQRIDTHTIESIKALQPDMILVVAFGQILPQAFLDIAPCLNLHASILPNLRGASPIQEMILAQPKFFGVSVMQMELGLDCGAILGVGYVENCGENLYTLSTRLAQRGAQVLWGVLKRLHTHSLVPLEQNNADSSYCTKITRQDGLITLKNAQEVYYKYLAYYGWPSVFVESGLKFTHIVGFEAQGFYKEGEIIKILAHSALIGCKQGYLEIVSVQPPNKKEMPINAYLAGARLQEGVCLL